jgi:hypothetical protein
MRRGEKIVVHINAHKRGRSGGEDGLLSLRVEGSIFSFEKK